MRENDRLRAKERFYEACTREYLKNLDTVSVKTMERRLSSLHELLKTEIAYRERVDRIQSQLSDMISNNNDGRNVLEKALDLLNESHEEECSAIKNEIEQSFQSMSKSENNRYASFLNNELPHEI